jgi:hypothetical protein
VSGTLVLRPAADLFNATVLVQLLDTTLIDIAGGVIGSQQFRVTGLRVSELPFCVAAPVEVSGRQFSFSAGVHRGGVPELASGDYVNMTAVPWQRDRTENVEIDVRRID